MKAILCQSLAVLILSIPNFLAAFAVTWTSYTEQLLESPESPIGVALTKTQMGLLASFLILGSVAAVATWHLPDVMGRKNTELLAGIIMTLSWSLITTAKSVVQLIIGRFLLGAGVGIHLLISVVYINEFSQPFIRGTMACIPIFFYSFGVLISYILGWVCSYHTIVYINLVISVVFAVSTGLLKESPVFLVTKGKDKEALNALKFYRGASKTTTAVQEELEYFKKQREAASYNPIATDEVTEVVNLNIEKVENKKVTELSAWKILTTSKAAQRALITVTSFCTLSMLMGLMAIQTYAGQFFSSAAPGLSPHLCSVIMAVAIAIGNGLAVFITDLVPRRVLMLSSCATCAVCIGALCTMLRWAWAPSWAIPACMLLYTGAFTVGAGNLPMVQLSECFTPKVRVLASAIFMCSLFSCNFVVVSLFGPAVDYLGLDGTFFLFFLITAAFTALVFFIMKETKGVPLEEIQGMYERGFLYWK